MEKKFLKLKYIKKQPDRHQFVKSLIALHFDPKKKEEIFSDLCSINKSFETFAEEYEKEKFNSYDLEPSELTMEKSMEDYFEYFNMDTAEDFLSKWISKFQ